MNEELAKIRELKGQPLEMDEVERIDPEEMTEKLIKINTNIGILKMKSDAQEYNEKEYLNLIVENIYIILEMFNKMNVYPGFFLRKIFDMNVKYWDRKKERNEISYTDRSHNRLRGDYAFFKNEGLDAALEREMRNGYESGKFNQYKKTNANDVFLEIAGLFENYNIPRMVKAKEECKFAFEDIYYNHHSISNSLANSPLITDEIECMCRLLYEYISFFVVVGKNPKYALDEYIEKHANEKEETKKHK